MRISFYTAARSQEGDGGIYGFDSDSKRIYFEPLKGVTYLAYSPDRAILYAVFREGTCNKVIAYHRAKDGSLSPVNRAETHGGSSCHITTDPAGQFLYCANYLTGDFNEFRLENGVFGKQQRLISYPGVPGPNRSRQEHAHAHCTVFTPDGKFLCVVDLGLDEVLLYPFTPGAGIAAEPSFRYRSANPGAGPRHILFSPDGRTAWLANEVDNTVSILRCTPGRLEHLFTLSTLPEDFTGSNTVAAIRLSPNGKHLCVSNRGHNSFACYAVSPDGLLKLHSIVSVNGAGPRDINFLPGGKALASCNEGTNNVTFFRYNPETGAFTLLPQVEPMPDPLCVI